MAKVHQGQSTTGDPTEGVDDAKLPARPEEVQECPLDPIFNELCRAYNSLRALWGNPSQRGELCQVALPHLSSMLTTLGRATHNEDRNPLEKVYQSVIATLTIVNDFSTVWPLNDPRLHMNQRIDWLMYELVEGIVQYRNPRERAADDDIVLKLRGCRTFLSEGKDGYPAAWRADYTEQRRQLRNNEVCGPVRLLGAEIFLLHQGLLPSTTASPNEIPPLNAEGFRNHLYWTHLRFENLAQKATGSYDLKAAADLTREMCRVSGHWADGRVRDKDLLAELWDSYHKLSALTIFKDLPGASQLGLALLEFNTDFSGVPHSVTPLVEQLEQRLVIDHSKKIPQFGFGYAIPAADLAHTLSCQGARLFTLLRSEAMVGFYIFVPNPPPEITHHPDLFDALRAARIIPEDSRPGWFAIVGVVPEGRGDEFVRAGVRSYALLDLAMRQTALQENCDVLVALVREGPMANLAKGAHLDLGWIETSFVVYGGAYGKTPYRVLIRHTEASQNSPFGTTEPLQLGERPHTLPYIAAPELMPRIRQAASISDDEALARGREFVSKLSRSWSAEAVHGSLNFTLRISSPYQMYNIHQLRPRTDFWRVHSSEETGSLDTVLACLGRDNFR